MVDPSKPIRRSPRDALVGGVCSGLAAWAGWDPSLIRVLFVLVTVFTGFVLGCVAYAALWVILPAGDATAMANTQAAVPTNPAA